MLQDSSKIIQEIPKEPFNWHLFFTIIFILVVGTIILGGPLLLHLKFKKDNAEWINTRKYMKSHSNGKFSEKYIAMPFKQFHEYYSLNPERYELKYASVIVRNLEHEQEEAKEHRHLRETSHIIIFSYKEYRKYRNWVEKVTNGMEDSTAVSSTLEYLNIVQKDIEAIRAKESEALESSQEAMKSFMEGYKTELKLDGKEQEEEKKDDCSHTPRERSGESWMG